MKRICSGLVLGFGSVSSAFAGGPSVGFSTIQITWSGAGATAIPTMSAYGMVLLALLLAVVVFRISRKQGLLVRSIAPLAAFGIAASFALMSERPVAGGMGPPAIEGSSCSGSATYTANGPTPPPCFRNTCGSPVTVSYTFISGQTPTGTPITADSCTYNYYCDAVGDGMPSAENTATDGAVIPSDGLPRATAYCQEIFEGGAG